MRAIAFALLAAAVAIPALAYDAADSVVGVQNSSNKSAYITVYVTQCGMAGGKPGGHFCHPERIGYQYCVAPGKYDQRKYDFAVTHVHAQVMQNADCKAPILMQRTLVFPFNNGRVMNGRKYGVRQQGNGYEFEILGNPNP